MVNTQEHLSNPFAKQLKSQETKGLSLISLHKKYLRYVRN